GFLPSWARPMAMRVSSNVRSAARRCGSSSGFGMRWIGCPMRRLSPRRRVDGDTQVGQCEARKNFQSPTVRTPENVENTNKARGHVRLSQCGQVGGLLGVEQIG